jgi:hypothetical protein
MAKKKVKATKKAKVNKSPHGELFDKHNNLIWLLPIFFIVAVIALFAIRNMYSGMDYVGDNMAIEEQIIINDNVEMLDAEDSMLLEDSDVMVEEEL